MNNRSRRIGVAMLAVLCMTFFTGCQTSTMKSEPTDSTGNTAPTASVVQTAPSVSTTQEAAVIESETSASGGQHGSSSWENHY
jgi:hypothetical protein